jgi:hypothetical protein
VFTARYALSPYIKQIRFVFKGLTVRNVTERLLLCDIFCSTADPLVCGKKSSHPLLTVHQFRLSFNLTNSYDSSQLFKSKTPPFYTVLYCSYRALWITKSHNIRSQPPARMYAVPKTQHTRDQLRSKSPPS